MKYGTTVFWGVLTAWNAFFAFRFLGQGSYGLGSWGFVLFAYSAFGFARCIAMKEVK